MDLEFQQRDTFASAKSYEERSGGQKTKKINRNLEEIEKGKFHSLLFPS